MECSREREAFSRRYVEVIVCTNMHINDMQFMMTEKTAGKASISELKAIAFAAAKSDKSDGSWFFKFLEEASSRERNIFQTGRRYLNYMEEKTFSLMKNDDVKLCLFVSMERGWGSRILSEAVKEFKARGYKNMLLWTDCECNVQWYFDNGWELVNEEEYEPFSRETGGSGKKTGDDRKQYMTYIFKKGL
ncbi:MAG: hypothetical protein II716_01830 [Treponema sp.]|nr:hypothetical protein [Treponema sp.]